ncbi:hypothetical protein BV25DRAFT_1767759, partial [Artomyces pyxidatus]
IVNEITTLRHHPESRHAGVYRTWAAKNKFISKLPNDVKAQKEKALQAALKQSQLDPHLRPPDVKEKKVHYTDQIFHEAAIQWLVDTDQPIQAFEHPSFKRMIDIAAAATNGVDIPGRKATRAEIINTFKAQMKALRDRLNV